MKALLTAAAMLAMSGCAVTEQAKSTAMEDHPRSGFLGDYSSLKPGAEGQALLVYIDPAVRWREYRAVMVDPVQFWGSPDLKPEQQQDLCNYYHAKLRERLATQLPIVEVAGPGTLRVRAALTDATTATPVLRTVSVTVPQARLLSSVTNLVSGNYAFVGEAQSEMEVLDAGTSRRLAAAVDRRSGGLSVKNVDVWKWGDAEKAMDYWADRVAQRLAELRSGSAVSAR